MSDTVSVVPLGLQLARAWTARRDIQALMKIGLKLALAWLLTASHTCVAPQPTVDVLLQVL